MGDNLKLNTLFRCDGSVEIGLGHVVRCLALADELKENYGCNIYFAMRRSELGISQVKESYPIFKSNEQIFDYEDWLSDCIKKSNAEILIMDIRDGLTIEQLKAIKKKTGIKVVTLDDPEDKRLEADLAFYPPIPQLEKTNWDEFQGVLYVGWEFVILRKEFSKTYPKPNNSIPNILVSMGGTDEKNMTDFVVNSLNEIKEAFKAIILVGPGYSHLEKLESNLKLVNYKFELYQNPDNVAEVMSTANLAIISFGVTAYELAALKIPSIYFCLTCDHEESSTLFEHEGIGKTISQYSSINKEKFIRALSSLVSNQTILNEMSKKANSITLSDLHTISSSILRQTVYE